MSNLGENAVNSYKTITAPNYQVTIYSDPKSCVEPSLDGTCVTIIYKDRQMEVIRYSEDFLTNETVPYYTTWTGSGSFFLNSFNQPHGSWTDFVTDEVETLIVVSPSSY